MENIDLTKLEIKKQIRFNNFILKKLTSKDAPDDYKAVMANSKLIRNLVGTNWPTDDLTYEDNLKDLIRHEQEFDLKKSFTYGIWDLDRKKYLGCVYIYLEDKPWFKAPPDSDAVVEMWTVQSIYYQGRWPELFQSVVNWIKSDWPFKQVCYSNKVTPKDININ